MKFPPVVDWRITSRCNFRCRFCYGPKYRHNLSDAQVSTIIQLFQRKGVKAVVITGGEPLMEKNLPKIMQKFKEAGIKIFLSTNGEFYLKQRKKIESLISQLALPLDGSTPDIHSKNGRSKTNYYTIIRILKHYSRKKHNIMIKVGTLVSQDNIKDLNHIKKLLEHYKISLWKIYEFIPTDRLKVISQRFKVPHHIFMKSTSELKSDILKISISSRKERNCAYFMLQPDGHIILPTDSGKFSKDRLIGTIFEDPDMLIKKWKNEIHWNNYKDNIFKTFDYNINKYTQQR